MIRDAQVPRGGFFCYSDESARTGVRRVYPPPRRAYAMPNRLCERTVNGMKRLLLRTGVGIGLAAILAALILIGTTCVFGNHRFSPATCTEPETCLRCGDTRGEPLGHLCSGETCTEPSVCLRCGAVFAEPLGHDLLPATCTEPETCARCGEIFAEPLGHDVIAATYQTPAICGRCGETFGEPVASALSGRAFLELRVGEPVPYTTASYEDRDVDVTGTAEIADYRVIEGDETFPAREGYEWHVATIRLVFAGDDARKNGAQSAYTFGDRYTLDNSIAARADENGMRAFAAEWYGMRVQCRQKTGRTLENDWYDRELRLCWEEGVQVPKGYDGALLILFHARLAENASRPFPPASEILDGNALVFRMQ